MVYSEIVFIKVPREKHEVLIKYQNNAQKIRTNLHMVRSNLRLVYRQDFYSFWKSSFALVN